MSEAFNRMKEGLKSKSTRKTLISIGLILFLILIISAFVSMISEKEEKRSALREKPKVEIVRGNSGVSGLEGISADVRDMKAKIDSLMNQKTQREQKVQELEQQIAKMTETINSLQQKALEQPLGTPVEGGASKAPTFSLPGSEIDLNTPLGDVGGLEPNIANGALPGTQPLDGAASKSSPEEKRPVVIGMLDSRGEFNYEQHKIEQQKAFEQAFEAKKKEPTVFMPAGSMFAAVLLTGVDMPTSAATEASPIPVVFRVKREAILPNYAAIDVRECFLLGSAYGQLSSERAILRAEAISCVTNKGKVLEAPIQAFITGPDGKVGIPGRLVSKQGAMIARALVGGIFSGLAGQTTPMLVPQLNLNSRQLWVEPDINEIMKQGFGSGISTAANAIAQFYLQMAKETFPVIEISAGEAVTVVVTVGGSFPLKGSTALQRIGENNGTQPQEVLQPAQATLNNNPKNEAKNWTSGAEFGKPPKQQPSDVQGIVFDAINRMRGQQ